jgi:hypothetical protein
MGARFALAQLDKLPWPNATGGNTRGTCPLDAYTRHIYTTYHHEPEAAAVEAHLAEHVDVRQCWHHRRPAEELRYIAEVTCFFVENNLQPYPDAILAVVVRDAQPRELADEIAYYFDVPMRWSFLPGSQLGNGRHRLCALKDASVPRVAVQIV